MSKTESGELYECVSCGHLYNEKVSQRDCMENPQNKYRTWRAKPKKKETKPYAIGNIKGVTK